MRVVVMIKGTAANEANITPSKEMLEAMGTYNEQLVKAGIMLDGQGLHPSSAGSQVIFEGGSTSVVDGPFTESKEIVAGFWIWQVRSLEEAQEWAKKCPHDAIQGTRQVLEIRAIYEAEDFGAEYTEELRERDAKMAEDIRAQHTVG